MWAEEAEHHLRGATLSKGVVPQLGILAGPIAINFGHEPVETVSPL